MTDSEYLKKLIALGIDLERAGDARPYDPDVYNDIVARLNALHLCKFYSRRRRPWAALASCIVLLIVLLWIVYQVLCVLYAKGV